MNQQPQTPQHIEDPAKVYNSNPFTLSFDALGRLFKSNVGWAITLVALGFFSFLAQVVSSIIDLANNGSNQASTNPSSNGITLGAPDLPVIIGIVIIAIFFVICFVILSTMIETFLKGMFTYVMLQSEKDKAVTFSESLNATSRRFWQLFWSLLLANAKILGWTFLFIIPGIIAALRYSLLPYLIMDQSAEKQSVKQSHDGVKSLVKGRIAEIFGVGTVAAIVPFVGYTLGIAGRGALYRQLRYSQANTTQKPKIHWLNYLGLGAIGLLVLLVLTIIGVSILLATISKIS